MNYGNLALKQTALDSDLINNEPPRGKPRGIPKAASELNASIPQPLRDESDNTSSLGFLRNLQLASHCHSCLQSQQNIQLSTDSRPTIAF